MHPDTQPFQDTLRNITFESLGIKEIVANMTAQKKYLVALLDLHNFEPAQDKEHEFFTNMKENLDAYAKEVVKMKKIAKGMTSLDEKFEAFGVIPLKLCRQRMTQRGNQVLGINS